MGLSSTYNCGVQPTELLERLLGSNVAFLETQQLLIGRNHDDSILIVNQVLGGIHLDDLVVNKMRRRLLG